ncbi:MAG: nucleoside 2-deoxyribosyltransferase domain-containing protein [Clostridia bacterium]|nr:nucleoside 2-deoxyribosyltransferase domain-containing protein [Clostridia bacterium]
MEVNYSNQNLILTGNSIFLAGPTPRDEAVHSWRPQAVKLLREIGFDGVVYVPEYSTEQVFQDYERQIKHDYERQVEWEWNALDIAGAILFWVPRNLRDMPAFTTNVEFGYWVREDRAFYGRPNNAELVRYLDSLYQRHHGDRQIPSDLRSLCQMCVDYVQKSLSK